jgi:hypothetical protein
LSEWPYMLNIAFSGILIENLVKPNVVERTNLDKRKYKCI